MAQIHEILRTLARHDARFIVVGGMSAVLQGAPVNTLDLDVVHDRSPENVERILGALAEMDAYYRADLANRRLRPTASHLIGPGHQLLVTKYGVLDVLGTVEETTVYEDLLPD